MDAKPLAWGGATAANAAAPLTIPTYDSSGQAMHPGIVDLGVGNTWNGYRYWMSMTPYTDQDNTVENPSIVCSNDGDTWVVPAGLTNPITPFPGVGLFNADAELILAQDNKLYCYYMESDESTYNDAYVKSSSDGVTWSNATKLFTTAAGAFGSPAVIWDGSQYVMWYTDLSVTPSTLQRRTCATPDGEWSAATQCTIVGTPSNKKLWHHDVTYSPADGLYYMFMAVRDLTSGVEQLWMMGSVDGLVWVFDSAVLLDIGDADAWDEKRIYRSSAIRTATGFDLWYSASNLAQEWYTGRTTVTFP